MPHTPGIGVIFGIVAEDGTPKANSPVRLYDRTTGQLVRDTTTDSVGGYGFSGLNLDTDDYQVLATDEDGSPKKNALVYDRIRPTNGASGSVYYASWMSIIGKYYPLRFVCGKRYSSDGWANVFPSDSRYATTINTGQVTFDTYAGLPGDPSLPAIRLNNGQVNLFGGTSRWAVLSSSGAQNGTTFTHFTIVDMSTAWSFKEYSSVPQWNNQGPPYLRMTWSGTVLTVQIRNNNNTASDDENYWQTLVTYTPAGGLTGYHSIAVSAFLGDTTQVYLDGVQIATATTNATNKVPYSNTDSYNVFPYYGRFYGSNYSAGTGQKLLVSALFAGRLPQANVQEIHNAFFIAQAPNLTGYKKEVALDGPGLFYVPEESSPLSNLGALLHPALDRSGITDRSATTTYNDRFILTVRGTPTVGQPSPIAGTNSTNFTNGCYRGNGGCMMGRYGAIYEFIIKRTVTSAPTVNESIARMVNPAYNVEQWGVRLTTTRKLQVFMTATASDTITPNYTVPDNTWLHVVIQVDRRNTLWNLYVNGVFIESGTTNSSAEYSDMGTYGDVNVPADNAIFELGGWYNNSNVMSNNFKGNIAAFAVYQDYPLLTAGRVQDHFNALTIL